MNCNNKIKYVLHSKDNLYNIARQYNTTVPDIISLNPSIDPYNLQIGSIIYVCPGGFLNNNKLNNKNLNDNYEEINLSNNMRSLLTQNAFWTRMLLNSISEKLADQQYVINRLLQNPSDVTKIFNEYYNDEVTKALLQTLTEFIEISNQLMTAVRDGKTQEAEKLKNDWHANIENISNILDFINPYYEKETIREILNDYVDLTIKQIISHFSGDIQSDIETFDTIENQAMKLADYLSAGIIEQFPQKFINQ